MSKMTELKAHDSSIGPYTFEEFLGVGECAKAEGKEQEEAEDHGVSGPGFGGQPVEVGGQALRDG